MRDRLFRGWEGVKEKKVNDIQGMSGTCAFSAPRAGGTDPTKGDLE